MRCFKRLFSTIVKWMIFLTSYIPLFVLIIIKDLKDLTINSLQTTFKENQMFISVILTLSVVSSLITIILFRAEKCDSIEVKEIEEVDENILEYFITYLIPLLEIELGNEVSILINTIIFIIIGVYQVKGNKLYLNIILIFLGYSIYKCNSKYILISKKNIDDIKINNQIKTNLLGNIAIY
ncbi:MAG: hypothetical protein AB7V48_15485 [Sedimentibacter sp.]